MSNKSTKSFLRNKTATIAAFLILTVTATIVVVPLAYAHDPPRVYAVYARVHIAPNPVGVGQQVIIVGATNWALPGALYANDIRLKNYTITVVKPDGTTFVQKYDLAPDPGGSAFLLYTPDKVGNYTVVFEHHGTNGIGTVYTWNKTTNPELTTADAANYGNIWLPASATATFTVQEEPVGTPMNVPLPTEYWTRPIEGQNWQWESVSSNWLGGASAGGVSISTGVATGSRWQQDGSGPKTPHVMWTKPIEFGGLVGGATIDSQTYYSGFSYETRFGDPIIISGVLFYRQPLGHEGSGGGYVAVDLRTGQEIWRRDDIAPTKGQLFDFQSPNQHGTVGAILWQVSGSTWRAFDAFTGKAIFNLTAVPTGYEVYDTRQRVDYIGATIEEATINLPVTRAGDITRYVISYNTTSDKGWLGLWSVAKAVGLVSPLYGAEGWRANGNNINSSTAFLWNATLPNLNGLSAPFIAGVIPGDMVLGASSDVALTYLPRSLQPDPWTMWALNLNESRGDVGSLLWIRNYTAPPGNITRMLGSVPIDPVNRVWVMTDFDTGQRLGYSIDTGDLLWSTDSNVLEVSADVRAMQLYSVREGILAYGILYVSGYGGEILAYSTKNGTLLWKFSDTSTTLYNTGIPWGLQPLHASAIADGVVYAFAGEHSPNTPLYKGNRHFAVDAFTGKKIWDIFGWSASGLGTSLAPVAIADGYLIYDNAYDGQIYSIGKGPSATTVTASPEVSVQGSSVLIKGTVLDIATGTKQNEQSARFPNGVAAVSDASMSAWMEYVYMQKPRPTGTTGVNVTLSVVDSNNNYRVIGQTTSNADGFFTLKWTPDIPGTYTVYASFDGSEGYWPSHAVTSFAVDQAPTPPQEPQAQPSMTDTYLLAGVAAIIVAIAIVGAVIVLMLRKRP